MAKLSDQSINFLNLLLRSDDRGDGWRNVSSILWRFVEEFDNQELIEAQKFNDGSGRVRLTPRGLIVADYI